MAIAKISEDTQAEVAASLYAQRALAIAYQGDHDRSIIAFEDVPLGTAARKRYVSTLATSYLEMGDADKAESALREVYGDGTGYDTPYSSVLLSIYYKTGAIGDAHRLYRSRKTTDIVASYFGKTHPKNVDFKSIRGSAVILSEGGPGDEIRFSTMYGELAEKFDQLAISASPRLLPLLKRSFPEIDFLSCSRYRNEFIPTDISDRRNLKERGLLYFVNDDVAERAFRADHVLTICDTLGDMRTSVRDFTGAPSLIPSPALVDEWRHRTNGTKKQIGLSWRSLLRSSARDRHYLDVQDLEPLSALTDTEFWLAQPGATAEEIEYLRNLVDLKVPADLDLKDDFDGQAAYFAALDAVISPLTATAELAGAVGARTLILSRTHIASWRQQTDGKDVWYGNAVVVTGDPIWDKGSLMNGLISEIVNTPRKRP